MSTEQKQNLDAILRQSAFPADADVSDLPAPPPDTGSATREVSTAASDATATPRSGAPTPRLGPAFAVIATAQLMVVLDWAIVNVALLQIQNALGFSDSNLAWAIYA